MAAILVVLVPPAFTFGRADADWDTIHRTANAQWDCASPYFLYDAVPCRANSNYHTYYFGFGVTNAMKTAVNRTHVNSYNYTDVNLAQVGTFTGSTDVYFQGTDQTNLLEDDALGLAYCDEVATPNICDQWTVYLNAELWDQVTAARQQKTAGHELGHTLGLVHPADSANSAGDPGNNSSTQFGFMRSSDFGPSMGSLQADNLNSYY